MTTDSFRFDDQSHKYLVNGEVWPSISFLLQEFGIIDTTYFKAIHAEKGHAVHRATYYFDDSDLDESTLDDETRAKLEGWKKFKSECNFKPMIKLREKPMIISSIKIGVTPDAPGIMGDKPSIIEIKSGQVNLKAVRIQTASQQMAVHENFHLFCPNRFVVQLFPGGYKLIELDIADGANDRAVVAALAAIYWYRTGGKK